MEKCCRRGWTCIVFSVLLMNHNTLGLRGVNCKGKADIKKIENMKPQENEFKSHSTASEGQCIADCSRYTEEGCKAVFVTPSGARVTCMLYKEPIEQPLVTDEGSTFIFNITEGFGTGEGGAFPQG